MHIGLVNRWYPPHTGFGGVSMYNYYLSRALIKLGHQVTVVTSRWDKDTPDFEEVAGIRIHRLLTQHHYWLQRLPLIGFYMRSLLKGLYSLRIARKLRQLEKSGQIDVIEFAEIGGEGYFYLRQPQRLPVVVRCHTPTFVLKEYYKPSEMYFNISITEAMEKYCILQAQTLTTPSSNMADVISRLCQVPIEEISVVPNALEISVFSQNGTDPNRSKGMKTVLHVGRLDRVKGIQELVQTIPGVITEHPNTQFVFLGGGEKWQRRLTDWVVERNLSNYVQFLGNVSQEKLISWYQRTDIAVVPTLNYESFSYTCAQAMAAGVPLVASKIGGIPETVAHGEAAILVPPGDVSALEKAIIDLLRNYDLRANLSKRGVEIAQSRFSADIVANQMLAIYRSII